ncbi:hypothetical protein BN1723_020958 [Verticillium longisporum]|uniref:Uncharacterized protein n=1 Tax=Verticillium longisporum TaxID=100787 RepID=A0A0G4KLF5_VERLO|nr:hypothetical protein BN1723_020958 [Verticillium longisporum]CRK40155.1 hypothetical protein BN1708_020684 [Verticillium longisporum]
MPDGPSCSLRACRRPKIWP